MQNLHGYISKYSLESLSPVGHYFKKHFQALRWVSQDRQYNFAAETAQGERSLEQSVLDPITPEVQPGMTSLGS